MQMIINGKRTDSSDGKTMNVYNPATNQVIDTVPVATKEDVDYAVDCAVAGQKIWGSVPLYKRGPIVEKYVELVKAHKEELARMESEEVGKTIPEAANEINNVIAFFTGFLEKAKHEYEESYPVGMEPNTEERMQIVIREPVGVIACIIPYNFPVSLFTHKVAPALVAGNSVVVKPASDCPRTLIRLCELLVEAGFPDGTVNIVTGKGSEVGAWLVGNGKLGSVSLTGSTAVGAKIAALAGQNITPVTLELGGNDPFIVCDDADVDMAVHEAVLGRLVNAGQICVASKRFIIHNSVKEEFISKLVEKVSAYVIGDPSDPKTQMGCLINEEAAKKVDRQVKRCVDQGARLLYGGERNGAFYTPTVLVDVTKEMDIMRDEEVFGPVFPIIGFDTVEEAIEIANNTMYGLSSGVCSRDIGKAIKIARRIEAGTVVINGGGRLRSREMPFGGRKKSGIGAEGVSCTLREVTAPKNIILKNILK
ncbi:MAG: aldehyde dehydrogenase [Lachnospiraceae bacterium]|jgi:acyl-CoA reductase-like NAD-dependent aldehyde dehydrogenase|nr:aldehyde dehydrogenase [Lachnospiraceae bacterium]